VCKTIEPEIGATVLTYDAASNVSWTRAPGVNLPSTRRAATRPAVDGGREDHLHGYDASATG
jgi:hypothetical protein